MARKFTYHKTGQSIRIPGMTLDYTTTGKVKISMYEYIEKLLTELPSDMNGSGKTPTVGHLFNVNNDAMKLLKPTAQLFYNLVAKLLYLSRYTRQDIQMAVASLCTRVKAPDEDDCKKTNLNYVVYTEL